MEKGRDPCFIRIIYSDSIGFDVMRDWSILWVTSIQAAGGRIASGDQLSYFLLDFFHSSLERIVVFSI